MVMKLNRVWDIRMPPASKKMMGGSLVPTVKGAFSGRLMQKKRRVAIEIHGPMVASDADSSAPSSSSRRDMLKRAEGTSHRVVDLASELKDDDRIILRILKKRKTWGLMRDNDDSSDEDSDHDDDEDTAADYDDGWVEYRKYNMEEIADDVLDRDDWEATLGRASGMERRELKFANKDEAEDFTGQLQRLRSLVEERAQIRLEAFRKSQAEAQAKIQAMTKGKSIPSIRSRDASDDTPDGTKAASGENPTASNISMDDEVQLLIEIASGTDLPIADHKSSDPYVVVYMGNEEIHRTQHIPHTINPIWTVDNGSLFVLHCTVHEFFASADGLCFYIKDYDGLSKNDTLAKLVIPQPALLAMAQSEGNKRFEMELEDTAKKTKSASKYFSPKLNIRVRNATPFDITFLRQLHSIKKSKKLGIYANQAFVAPHAESIRFMSRESKVENGVTLHRVKPFPDPSRDEHATKWLDKDAIMKEAMSASTNWIETGSGTLGKLYLEILHCDKLANKDKTGKTDAFASVIFEDAIVNTDVINDELSPRFMPWSKRAFCFNVQHPSSQILIGILDFDSESGMDDHDPVGRVTIDITNFRPSTEYLLTYNLHKSVLDDVRSADGTVTVRLRIEYNSYRDFVKGSLAPPPLNYINLSKKSDFKASYFVCNGEENLTCYDADAIKSYRAELEGYICIAYYVTQAAMTVLLWRGHKEVSIFGKKLKLPLHSVVAFLMGILLIDNFNYLPSFFLFSIAWLFIATNELRQRNPSPWHGSMTFMEMWHAVIRDKAPPIEIADNENEAAVRKYEAALEARHEKEKLEAQQAKENAAKLNEFLNAEENAANEEVAGMETKMDGKMSLNPLASILLPIQNILGLVCKSLRIVRSLLMWDESIYSFLIVNACLIVGFLLMWVPWGFIIRWTIRILIWVLLGPWMKLVDIYYVQKLEEEGDNQVKRFKEMAKGKMATVNDTRRRLMIEKEKLTKVRAMKRYMFGKYVTAVPHFKTFRFPDRPLPHSSAKPLKDEAASASVKISETKHGQRLVGPMIPTWADVSENKD